MWRPAGESFPQIGLGWFLSKRGAERVVGHNGSDTGFVADVELLPERGIGVIVLCNLDHGPYRPLMLAALDAALGKTPEAVFKPSLARDLYLVSAAQGAEAAVARYGAIKREQPGRYDFNEWVLNDLGYKLAGSGKLQEAVRILRLNVEEYPASANVYDSLADACYRSGDKACAIENYRKALEKNAGNKKSRGDAGEARVAGPPDSVGDAGPLARAAQARATSLLDWALAASSEGRPLRWASTSRAHSRPSAMAQTTSDCPRRMSPAVKTPSREVR